MRFAAIFYDCFGGLFIFVEGTIERSRITRGLRLMSRTLAFFRLACSPRLSRLRVRPPRIPSLRVDRSMTQSNMQSYAPELK